MSVISMTSSGNTDRLDRFLKEMKSDSIFDSLQVLAQEGVAALETATPKRSGVAAGSWYSQVTNDPSGYTISWLNSDKDDQGTQIVIMIQYGHGTGTGGYVGPHDFINPVTQVIFDDISDAVWKAVQSA